MIFELPFLYVLWMFGWLVGLSAALAGLMVLRRSARLRQKKLHWVHAGLSLWMLLVALTLGELAFALFVDRSDSFNMTNVSQRWFQRYVESQRNSFGTRDVAEFPVQVPDGVRRICFVGDSFTIGQGIRRREDRFSDRVGALLDKARPGKFVVANLADPGLEISQIEARVGGLFEEGYKIDVVVYVICLNDIEAYDPHTSDNIRRLQQLEPRFFLFRDTYLFNWIYFRALQAARPEVRGYYTRLGDSYDSPAWEPFRTHLAAMKEHCERHAAELRVAIFPFVNNLGAEYPFTAAHKKIADYCREKGIAVLDLEPVFREHAGENLTVNRYDAHPNERAHEIAAEAIYNHLLDDLAAPAAATR